ncbi:MAG: hypothetical protein KI788_07215 [Mameliella sp.]|nr:hypothetical protein [Mameliella sp.]
MTETYSFRPAPLRGPQDWQLDGDTLTGPQGTLDLSTVDQATLVDSKVQLTRMRRLDLTTPSGLIRIAINSRLGLPGDHPDRAAHRTLCSAVAERLARHAPDLPVRIGETGRLSMVWFGIGVLALVMGPGLGIAALATGVDADRLVGMVVPVAALALFGAVIMHGHAPWRRRPEVPVSTLPALLERLDRPGGS